MGFSLELFFAELIEILDSEMGAAKKLKRLAKVIADAREYAKQCGKL